MKSLHPLKSFSVPNESGRTVTSMGLLFSGRDTDNIKLFFFPPIFQLVEQVGRDWGNERTSKCTLIMGFQSQWVFFVLCESLSWLPLYITHLPLLLLSLTVQGWDTLLVCSPLTEQSWLCCVVLCRWGQSRYVPLGAGLGLCSGRSPFITSTSELQASLVTFPCCAHTRGQRTHPWSLL